MTVLHVAHDRTIDLEALDELMESEHHAATLREAWWDEVADVLLDAIEAELGLETQNPSAETSR